MPEQEGASAKGHDRTREVTTWVLLEGNRVSRISVRGFAVASATAVTTVGAVVGVASGDELSSSQPIEAAAATTVLAEIPVGQDVQQASLTQQAQAQSDAADATAKQATEEAARKQAAKDAAAKKAAQVKAEADAKAAREAAEAEAASRSNTRANFAVQSSYTVAEVQAMAQTIVGSGQFQCFSNIVNHESTWNYQAENPSSGAYGLVQALPASKMSSVGDDWRTNPATQIKWGLGYMNDRYGSPCDAWSFWQVNHYY